MPAIPLLFTKSHVKQYTRRDGTVVKEHDDKRQAARPQMPGPGRQPGQEQASAQRVQESAPAYGAQAGYGTHNVEPGDKLHFEAGAFKGQGQVKAVGEHGAQVDDETGRTHNVHWHEVRGFQANRTPEQQQANEPKQPNTVLGKQDPIPAASFKASDYAQSHDQADVSEESVLANFPPDTKEKIAKANARLVNIEQTLDQFKKDGVWTAERKKLHDSIRDKILSPEIVKNAMPPEGTPPTFILLGGRGGCLSADHEFLTKSGWKRIDQYSISDDVLVYDVENNSTKFEPPEAYINLPCDEFYHFKSRGMDMMLSEEHTVLFNKKFNREVWRTEKAKDIAEQHGRLAEGWDGLVPCSFPAPENVSGIPLSDDELRLMVAVCADGSFALQTTNHCRMALRKDRKKSRIEGLLDSCGIEYSHATYSGRETESRYSFYAPQNNKSLSSYWSATPHQLEIIADELLHWDGWVDKYGSWIYTTTQLPDADFVNYVFSTQGRRSSFYCDDREGTNWKPIWRVSGAKNGGLVSMRYGGKKSNIDIVPSVDGRKYCFTTSTGYFITRRNDSICITGNSGKSSFVGQVYDPKTSIVLDADHIKSLLPEYEGWNAAQVHEESGEIFDSLVKECRELGVNVVLDKTMKTAKSALKDVADFKGAGYRTEAHYMHLPRQEAAKRAVGRFLNGGPNGRYVPIKVVLENTTNESAFDQVREQVDAWSFRDNNVPKGSGPILISQSDNPPGFKPSNPSAQPAKTEAIMKAVGNAKMLLWRIR